jgi:CO dehydrogenase maturation factor
VKLAVTGKGGVGKTTVAASLARALCAAGERVVAVDADPDANLAGTLGYRGPQITPLVRLKALVEERVGGGEGWGGFLRMNPKVDDIPEQIGILVDGVRVLVMGTIEPGRRGCACPENVLLREVLSHLVLSSREHVVVDMEAGIEHLGRGTAQGVDLMLAVVEPGWASLETARRVAALASDIGIPRLAALANKVRFEEDVAFVRKGLGAIELLGALSYDAGLEREARSAEHLRERPFHAEIDRIARRLLGREGEKSERQPA